MMINTVSKYCYISNIVTVDIIRIIRKLNNDMTIELQYTERMIEI
jgi:hypothetical protein